MKARLLLPIPILVAAATFAAAFAPAPVYREPPKLPHAAIEQAMQGTWNRSLNTKAKGARPSRVRIEGKTWTNLLSASRGGNAGRREGPSYTIHLDTARNPVTLDLRRSSGSNLVMRGIVKLEGDRLIFCYISSTSEEDRPKSFLETESSSGRRVMTMTLTRVESNANSP